MALPPSLLDFTAASPPKTVNAPAASAARLPPQWPRAFSQFPFRSATPSKLIVNDDSLRRPNLTGIVSQRHSRPRFFGSSELGRAMQTFRCKLDSVALAACIGLAPMTAWGFSFDLIAPPPCATVNLSGINNTGDMAGSVTLPTGETRGAIRSAAGVYVTFAVRKATIARGISEGGAVVGYFGPNGADAADLIEFLRNPNGSVVILKDPVSHAALHGTASSVNKSGMIVGDVLTPGSSPPRSGYILDGSNITPINLPNKPNILFAARGINDSGLTVGWSRDKSSNHVSGFVWNNGDISFVNYPNSTACDTYLSGVNNEGIVSGDCVDSTEKVIPFLYDVNQKTFEVLPYPPGINFSNSVRLKVGGLDDNGHVLMTKDDITYLYKK